MRGWLLSIGLGVLICWWVGGQEWELEEEEWMGWGSIEDSLRTLQILRTLATLRILGLLKAPLQTLFKDSQSDLPIDSLGVTQSFHTRPDPVTVSSEGWVRCDRTALTCLFGNLMYVPGEGFSVHVRDWSTVIKWSGAFMQPGIGSPSEYFYLDTWTFAAEGTIDGPTVEEALQRIRQEREWTPNRELHPVYVRPSLESPLPAMVLEEAAILFSVLWPRNFFRTLYAGTAALFSLYEWNAVAPAPVSRINVILLDTNLPRTGHYHLFRSFHPAKPITKLVDQTQPIRFRIAVLGLSRNALLQEIEFSYPDANTSLRSSTYNYFSSIVRRWIQEKSFKFVRGITPEITPEIMPGITPGITPEITPEVSFRDFSLRYSNFTASNLLNLRVQGPLSAPRVVLVVRRDTRRRILNLTEVLDVIRRYPVSLEVVAFEDHSLKEQIQIVSRADIMIAVHGAALSHILFMRNGATVVELFPYGFRKRIYQNLANTLGVHYAIWQCPRASCSVPNLPGPGGVEVDWTSQSSKDYWRNQDLHVDLVEFSQIFRYIFDGLRPKTTKVTMAAPNKDEKYLIHLPWEQFNNQLVGFKSACAVAHFLNRTLIIPPVGFRKTLPPELQVRLAHTVRIFQPREFEWRPFGRYFDVDSLQTLPCRTVPFDSFTALTRRVGVLLMRRLGQSVRVIPQQMGDYFHWIANLEYEKIAALPVYVPLYFERVDIDRYLRRYDRDRVLSLGTMFWMYSFSGPLEFPARSYQNKLHDPLYRKITAAMAFHPDLLRHAAALNRRLGVHHAVHLRRGDYAQKCYDEGMGASQESEILRACYQTPRYLAQRIRSIQKSQRQRHVPWFLATNDPNLQRLRQILSILGIRTVILSEINDIELDPIETCIMDQLLCIHALFIMVPALSIYNHI
ncbi:DUF563 domain-containing protein [Paramicrosporidium saccamoebae]|uniref:DUF563 domain-containing protein n=1 Tax=Paramicrosporidium saccamoebae TaxID=1246581 RepID=A0A2H9TMQ9_9FUNG|nr:DUF563 domain-containing protein [Paramicrosporidium saccamoebae]